jgi:hypothetical protein
MSDTTSMILTETAIEQAGRAAGESGFKTLSRWLESGGPWLKLAGQSSRASDLVHSYRVALDTAASSGAGIAQAAYKYVREELGGFIKSPAIEQELRNLIELELRRADALIGEVSKQAGRTVVPSGLVQPAMTQEATELLQAWSKQMKNTNVSVDLKAAFAKVMARIKPNDNAWASIADIALDRAKRVKDEFPAVTRATYKQNSLAEALIEGSYTSHGKGEIFEHLARNSEPVKNAMDGELRAAAHRAAQRGSEWAPVLSAGEIRYGYEVKGGAIGGWKKAPDTAVLIVTDTAEKSASAGASAARKIDGIAEPTAFFQFKAEAQASKIPQQQLEDLPRIIDPWAKGKPVYIAVGVTDETGKVSTKTYLLKPPDSKAGLSYYGVGTDKVFIGERDILAKQGANVSNMNLDIHNDEMRGLWYELFWTAFESL